MALPGETLALGACPTCPDCRVTVDVDVHRSNAGYYVGSYCGCGPYTRESGYYRTQQEAADALRRGTYSR